MESKEPQHCWEFRNCPEETKKKCPAFLYPNETCWLVASGKWCPKAKERGVLYCAEFCGWYAKLNPGNIIDSAWGKHLGVFRDEEGMTIADLAEKLGVSPDYIVQLENGDVTPTEEQKGALRLIFIGGRL